MAGFLLAGLIGNNKVSNRLEHFLTDMTTTINTLSINVFQEARAQCHAGTYMEVSSCPPPGAFTVINSEVNIISNAVNNCTFEDKQITDVAADFTTEVEEAVKRVIEQDATSKSGFLSFGLRGVENSTQIEELIITETINSFTADVTQTCVSINTALASGKVELCGFWQNSTLNIETEAINDAATSCVMETIFKVWVNNKIIKDFFTETNQKALAEEEGLGSILKYILIGLAIVAGIIILIFVFYLIYSFLSPSPKSAPTTIQMGAVPGKGAAKPPVSPKKVAKTP